MILRRLLSILLTFPCLGIVLLAGACASYSPPARAQGTPAQWGYSLVNGQATATYPGNATVTGSLTSGPVTGGNPTLPAGFNGLIPDGSGSAENVSNAFTYTGTRTTAQIGVGIQINDGQSGPASSAGVSTAGSASYGISLVGMRPNWNTSAITGEMDGANIFLRQANGDAAGWLTNVGARSGFAAIGEGSTYSFDNTGAIVKGINAQLGVVNSRDGGEYGLAINSLNGSLAAGVRIAQTGTSTFTDAFQFVNSSGTVITRLRGADGAWLGTTFAPVNDLGGTLGGQSARFASAWSQQFLLSYIVAGSVATPAAGFQSLYVDNADANLKLKLPSAAIVPVATTNNFGYGVASIGNGGAVAQATSRSTGVTLNAQNGEITLFNTTTTAGQITTFQFSDNLLAATDHLVLNQKTGAGIYVLAVTQKASGLFNISVYTPVAVGVAEAPVISFARIAGSNN